MEALLFGTLGYLGNSINEDNKQINTKTKRKHKKHVYSSDMKNNINKVVKKQAKKIKNDGFASQFDTLMFDNTGGPVSANQSNVIKKEGFSGYDVTLQRDIDFKNGYSEFTNSQMHYDVVPNYEMMSSNMKPNTRRREFTNNSDYSHKLGLMTGTDKLYKSKDNFDPVRIFEPMKDLTYVHGAPVFTNELEKRYVPSYKNNNGDLPFENNVKIQPGINGEVQDGLHSVYRIMPKSIDELRSKTNKKVTYKADKIEAVKKGEYRGAGHNLTKYKKPTHRERGMSDYLPNSAPVNKNKNTGKWQNINTNRSTSMNVVGHAHDPTKGNKKNGRVTESGKTTFANDTISRHLGNDTNKPVLQNKKSYRNVENERDSTNHNIPGMAHDPNQGSYAFDINDIPLTTLRQLMINGDTNIGVTANHNPKSYLFSKDNVLPQTIRSMTSHKSRVGTINPEMKETHYFNDNDVARQTIRQTTGVHNIEGNVNPQTKEGHYFNDNDTARQTIRQTTGIHNIEGNVNPQTKEGHYFNDNDTARQTIRQTTQIFNVEGTVNPQNKEGHYFNEHDSMRPTIRQTTSQSIVEGNTKPIGGAPVYINYKDTANKTIKETTVHNKYSGNTGRTEGQNVYMYNNKSVAKPTIKHSTLFSAPAKNINRSSQGNYTNAKGNIARTTIRQTTSHMNEPAILGNTNVGYARDRTDVAKPTIKQTTLHSNTAKRVTNEYGTVGYTRDMNDIAKNTIKQSTLHSGRGNIGKQEGNVGYSRDCKDEANPTIRQTTLHSSRGHISNPDGSITYARDINDKAKPTIKQTTLHSTREGRLGREGNVGYSRDLNDKAKITIKQTTLLKNHTGPLKGQVEKHKGESAERNMTIDERKEILTYNRPANPKSDRVGPVLTRKNVILKKENFLKRDNYGFDKSKCNVNALPTNYTRGKSHLNNPSYRINTTFINTLKTNPLVNDLMHQKNNDDI